VKSRRSRSSRSGSWRRLAAVLAAAAVFAAGADAVADQRFAEEASRSAAIVCVRTPCWPPTLELIPDARVSPQSLPRRTRAPIVFRGGARIAIPDFFFAPALREATLRIDRDVVIDAVGLPVCAGPTLDIVRSPAELKEMCRKAIVGSGTAEVDVHFPEVAIPTTAELVVFNGGVEGDTTTLYVYAHVPIPFPRAVVATVEVRRAATGKSGWRVEVEIPPIAGGSGSLRAFDLTVRRSFFHAGAKKSLLSARCPRGKLEIEMPRAVFRNEPSFPDQSATILTGRLQVPCTPLP